MPRVLSRPHRARRRRRVDKPVAGTFSIKAASSGTAAFALAPKPIPLVFLCRLRTVANQQSGAIATRRISPRSVISPACHDSSDDNVVTGLYANRVLACSCKAIASFPAHLRRTIRKLLIVGAKVDVQGGADRPLRVPAPTVIVTL